MNTYMVHIFPNLLEAKYAFNDIVYTRQHLIEHSNRNTLYIQYKTSDVVDIFISEQACPEKLQGLLVRGFYVSPRCEKADYLVDYLHSRLMIPDENSNNM